VTFFRNNRRRRNHRPHVSPVESAVGVVVLVLLAAIAGAVYVKGRHYDPGIFALDASLLPRAEDAPAAEQAVRLPEEPAEEGAPQPTSAILPPTLPAGWRALGPVERFVPANLYVKINGRAEQYRAYGVVSLEVVSAGPAEGAGHFLDIYVYDMGTDANALGIFSVERSPGEAFAVGEEGYIAGNSLYFRQGRFYTQILASAQTPALRSAMAEIARQIASTQPAGERRPWAFDAFPAEGLVPNSVQYLPKDAFGLPFLKEVYTARYRAGDTEVVGFLMRAKSLEAAQAALDGYAAYVEGYGEKAEDVDERDGRRLVGDLGGMYDVVFRKGLYVGGVNSAWDREAAEALARRLRSAL
jgi:hypothetical protein